jgi:hypothetical protein
LQVRCGVQGGSGVGEGRGARRGQPGHPAGPVVARRQADGSWLRVLDQPEFTRPD